MPRPRLDHRWQRTDGVVIHDVLPKLIEDGLRGGAVDGKFIDDLRFVPGPQLLVGNQPDEDLGGNVLVDGAAAVFCSGFHVVAQGQGGVDHGFLLGGKSGVIVRLVITDTRVYAYTELDAVGSAEGFQVVDPQLGELIGTVAAKRGGKIGTEGIPSGVMVDHGDVPVVIVGAAKALLGITPIQSSTAIIRTAAVLDVFSCDSPYS